jgi:hypothetical protein
MPITSHYTVVHCMDMHVIFAITKKMQDITIPKFTSTFAVLLQSPVECNAANIPKLHIMPIVSTEISNLG